MISNQGTNSNQPNHEILPKPGEPYYKGQPPKQDEQTFGDTRQDEDEEENYETNFPTQDLDKDQHIISDKNFGTDPYKPVSAGGDPRQTPANDGNNPGPDEYNGTEEERDKIDAEKYGSDEDADSDDKGDTNNTNLGM